jgi:hypothetical protein
MKSIIFITTIFIVASCTSCNSNKIKDAIDKSTSTSSETKSSSESDETTSSLLDTTKLKSDLSDIITSVASGNPDTTKLKNAASDIITTDAKILSDSGIDKMYGNSNDPAVKAAANTLKKMRNGMGLTPGKLDSMKKEAEKLKSNH